MKELFDWSFVIGIVIGGLGILWLIKASRDNEVRNKCATCGLKRSSQNELVQCPVCKKWFCIDNLEMIVEADTILQKIIDVIPSKEAPVFPCGTKYISMGVTKKILCKKDSERPAYAAKISVSKQ